MQRIWTLPSVFWSLRVQNWSPLSTQQHLPTVNQGLGNPPTSWFYNNQGYPVLHLLQFMFQGPQFLLCFHTLRAALVEAEALVGCYVATTESTATWLPSTNSWWHGWLKFCSNWKASWNPGRVISSGRTGKYHSLDWSSNSWNLRNNSLIIKKINEFTSFLSTQLEQKRSPSNYCSFFSKKSPALAKQIWSTCMVPSCFKMISFKCFFQVIFDGEWVSQRWVFLDTASSSLWVKLVASFFSPSFGLKFWYFHGVPKVADLYKWSDTGPL